MPFSQRTQGAHSGREWLDECVGTGWGPGRAGDGQASDVVLGWTGEQRLPPQQVGRNWRGCPGGGAPTGGWAKGSHTLGLRSEPGRCGGWRESRHGGWSCSPSFLGSCCAPASNSAERILGDETHKASALEGSSFLGRKNRADCGRVIRTATHTEDPTPEAVRRSLRPRA